MLYFLLYIGLPFTLLISFEEYKFLIFCSLIFKSFSLCIVLFVSCLKTFSYAKVKKKFSYIAI